MVSELVRVLLPHFNPLLPVPLLFSICFPTPPFSVPLTFAFHMPLSYVFSSHL